MGKSIRNFYLLARIIFFSGLLILVAGPSDFAAAGLKTQWDLTHLYSDLDAWRSAKAGIESKVAELRAHEGTLARGPEQVRSMFEAYYALTLELDRLVVYANMASDLDIRKPEPLGRKQELAQLLSEVSAETAWMDPELLSLPPGTLATYLESDPGLRPYRRYLERLEKRRPHVLVPEVEEVLSLAGMIQGDGSTIGSILRNAEMSWRTVRLSDDSELKVDVIGYIRGRSSEKREDRIKTYDAFYGALGQYQQSLATTLGNTVKAHFFNSRVRGYEDTLEASLSRNEVDSDIYRMLVQEVNRALPVLHKYLRLRSRMLGIEDLSYHDLYPPLVGKVEGEYPWEKTVEVVLESFAPMGSDYVERLLQACEEGWIDVYPAEGKRSGAYVTGGAYDVHPYMLLNHRNDYASASTFAHEAGHLMHSALSNRTQPYPLSDYVIFVAEVASTTQQWLFFRHTLAQAESKEEKLAILGNFLELFRLTVFRQTMFAEFERSMHELVEDGKPLTSKSLNEIYLKLLRRYHGHDAGICKIDEKYQTEWAFVPHFHRNYYVYTYATSFISAAAFQEQILTGKDGGVERYLSNLLEAGGSQPPAEILKNAGVDMTTVAPFRAAMQAMSEIIEQIEDLL